MYLGSILIATVCCLVVVWCVDVDFQTACQAVTSKRRAMYRGSCYIVEDGVDGDSAASYCTHLDVKYRPPDGQPQLAVFAGQTGLEEFLINALVFWVSNNFGSDSATAASTTSDIKFYNFNDSRSMGRQSMTPKFMFGDPPAFNSVWLAARRLSGAIAWPNTGFNEWYIKFNGIYHGPIIPPDNDDFWIPRRPTGNGQCVVLNINTGYGGPYWRGGWDRACTGLNYRPLCEYRSRRRKYRQVMVDKRAASGLVLSNTTYTHRIECADACQNNWICSSFAYNEATKDCYLQFTDSTVNATKLLTYFEAAPGYRMYEVEDTFEVTLN